MINNEYDMKYRTLSPFKSLVMNILYKAFDDIEALRRHNIVDGWRVVAKEWPKDSRGNNKVIVQDYRSLACAEELVSFFLNEEVDVLLEIAGIEIDAGDLMQSFDDGRLA